MYDFRLMVDLPNGKRAASAFMVDSEMALYHCLEPMHVCTDSLTALAMGEKTLVQAKRIRADRSALACHISVKLTDAILKIIEEQDTVN